MCPIPWLYVSYRGYTWLYTASVPQRSQNHIVTAKVVSPSSGRQQLVGKTLYGGFMWLYAPSHGYTFESVVIPIVLHQMLSTSYQEKNRGCYVSLTVVVRLTSWLYVIIYCICTKNELEARSESQGRPPFIMTSATSRKAPKVDLCGYTPQAMVRHSPWL